MRPGLLACVALVALGACAGALEGYAPSAPLARVEPNGQARGALRVARSRRRHYAAFTGLPFARAPVGPLRFQNPEPYKEKWSFPYDATKPSPVCIQKNYLFAYPTVQGQEDCLYLNVYTPKLPWNQLKTELPVMVFFHWGGFLAGRSSEDYLGADYFMDEDIVLVIANYRLGPFGLLTTLDDNAPGNSALKDQRLTLKWVQENIGYFGGDKHKVTIFGQSAGGGSTHFHILSPSSKGLFSQAISQSGNALAPWAKLLNPVQVNVTVALGQAVGCQDPTDNQKLINCLQKTDAAAILNAQDYFKSFNVDPLIVFTPVVEVLTEKNPEPFFTRDAVDVIHSGDFNRVPWIIGGVKGEGSLRVQAYVRQSETLEALNKNFSFLLPSLLGFTLSTRNPTHLYKGFIQQYMSGRESIDKTDAKSIEGFLEGYSDRTFLYSMYQSAMLHSAVGHKPIWMYTFEYKGEYTYGDWFASTNETVDFDWGNCHCDDLLYLFRSPALFPDDITNKNDLCVSRLLINMWTYFAIHGTPQSQELTELGVSWENQEINGIEDMHNEKLKVLNISGTYTDHITIKLQRGYHKDRMLFWANQNLTDNFYGLH